MLRYKHLKPSLLVYLISTVLLFLGTIGITVIIILKDINGFNFSSVQFSTCLASTNFKLNTFMHIILQICFILSIGGIVFALGQLLILVWQFFMLRKDTEAKGQSEENTFEDLTLSKLIILYVLNAMGFLCIVPIIGSSLSFYIEFANCIDPQNLSSTYFLPTIVAGGALIFQIWSFCMLLKLFYHFEHQDNDNNENAKNYSKLNNTARDREKDFMEEMRQKMKDARRDLSKNKYAYNGENYISNSTEQESPRQMENGLLKKRQRNYHPEGDSIYEDPVNPGYHPSSPSRNRSGPKPGRGKYGSKKGGQASNKYRYDGDPATNQTSQLNTSNPVNANKPTNSVNPSSNQKSSSSNGPTNPNNQANQVNSMNSTNPSNKNIQTNKPNQVNSNNLSSPSGNTKSTNNPTNQTNSNNQNNIDLNSKNSSNASKNIQQDPKKESQNKTANKNSNENETGQMTPQQISEKQKELMKTLPKHPYKKNANSKHLQPSDVIFEQPGSQEEGSEQQNLPLTSRTKDQKSTQNLNQTNPAQKNSPTIKTTPNSSKDNANLNLTSQPPQQLTSSRSQEQSLNLSPNQSPKLSPSMSPIMSPENNSFDFQDLQDLDLNNSPQKVNQPIRLKYLNSPYLKNLKNKNITPEERRKLKRPFLKLSSIVMEFDAKNYEVTDPNVNYLGNLSHESMNDKKNKNLKNGSEAINDPKNPNLADQNNPSKDSGLLNPLSLLSQSKSSDNIKSQSNPTKSKNSISTTNLIHSILQAQKLQQENPIIDYIQEDQDYEDRLQKILAFEKISKKRRRYLYNPFDTGENKNNEKLYLHKNKMDKGLLLTQNEDNSGYDAFQDDDFDNNGYGAMKKSALIEDEGSPSLRLDKRSNTKQSEMSQVKKSKKEGMLLDFIRSKHVLD